MEVVKVLLAQFGALIQAPADVEKLNTAVLGWAVQGRLVEQDPNDEPAAMLLEQIAKEQGKLARVLELSDTKESWRKQNLPYSLPNTWQWCYLGDVVEIIMGQSPPGSSYNSEGMGVPLINGPVEFSSGSLGKTLKTKFTTSPTKLCKEGDLILCVRGSTTGRTNIAGFGACIGRGVAAIRAYFFQDYLNVFFLSHRQHFYELGTGSTFPSVSSDKIYSIPYPLPPLAEQKRIVAKVETVLGQTRVLARQMGEVEEKRKATRQAALRRLVTAESQTDVATAWEFIAQHFHDLYTEPEAVQELKQAILQLAVQGRLVPQDPNDEETAVLLERITAERESLVKAGKTRRIDNLPPITLENMPKIPPHWGWIRLGNLLLGIKAGHSPNAQGRPAQNGEFGVLKVSAVTWGTFNPHENKALLLDTFVEGIPAVKAGDLLISRANTAELVGAVVLVEQDYPYLLLSDKTLRLDFVPNSIYKPFILLALRAFWVRNLFTQQAIGTSSSMRNISQEKICLAPIALPSLNEQKRIVAKVNELFSLCDQLAAQLTTAQTAREQALTAILAQAV